METDWLGTGKPQFLFKMFRKKDGDIFKENQNFNAKKISELKLKVRELIKFPPDVNFCSEKASCSIWK